MPRFVITTPNIPTKKDYSVLIIILHSGQPRMRRKQFNLSNLFNWCLTWDTPSSCNLPIFLTSSVGLAWLGLSIIDPILCEKKSSLPPDAIIHQNRSGANKPLRMARTHRHVNHTCNGVNNGHKCFLSGEKLFRIPRM